MIYHESFGRATVRLIDVLPMSNMSNFNASCTCRPTPAEKKFSRGTSQTIASLITSITISEQGFHR